MPRLNSLDAPWDQEDFVMNEKLPGEREFEHKFSFNGRPYNYKYYNKTTLGFDTFLESLIKTLQTGILEYKFGFVAKDTYRCKIWFENGVIHRPIYPAKIVWIMEFGKESIRFVDWINHGKSSKTIQRNYFSSTYKLYQNGAGCELTDEEISELTELCHE